MPSNFWETLNDSVNLIVGLYEGLQSACTANGMEQSENSEIILDENQITKYNRISGYQIDSNSISSYSTRVSSLSQVLNCGSSNLSKCSSIQDIPKYNENLYNNITSGNNIQLPHNDVPDLSNHTRMYLTRSHILMSVLCCQNINKIVESSITCGDFKLKGPGFRLENIYIPIRNEKSSIELKITTFNINNKRNDLMIDIPISVLHKSNETYRFWLILNDKKDKYGDYSDMLPEAIFRLNIDDENSCRINEPKVLVSFMRVMTGIIEDIQPNSMSKRHYRDGKNSYSNKSLIYVGLYNDPIDLEVSDMLNNNPILLANNTIERLNFHDGYYRINNIQVSIQFGYGEMSNILFVQDETSRQPLFDYLNNSNENIEWLSREPSNATELVPPNILPDFSGTQAPWEVEIDRRKAMELACHRAALREHIAIQYLIDTGYPNPPHPKFSQWLTPPLFRVGQQFEPVPMSYNWGPNYSNIQLIPLEKPKQLNIS
ncbi:hypothetical protein cand_038070 [Cryptosporidium andersoni]|uniref:Uncharacterized protein n=1 Tax=Cryptosporidium andersoni TaxID=117008 RepID=A0A1J4MXV6_9CRYT|nr:hypothetical protein cand_038070 [Cryptosporidium andersoni]